MKSILWASLGAALLGGGLVAFLQRPAIASKPAETPGQHEFVANASAISSDLEARIARLENHANAPSSPSSTTPDLAAAPPRVPDLSPEEAAARNRDRHRTAIADHDREPIDPKWGPATKRAFEEDLAKLAGDGHFEVARVDCRTTTCVADVTFGNYGAAVRDWKQLLMGRYSTNCGREVLLDDAPQDGAAKFSTTVVFDCLNSRTE